MNDLTITAGHKAFILRAPSDDDCIRLSGLAKLLNTVLCPSDMTINADLTVTIGDNCTIKPVFQTGPLAVYSYPDKKEFRLNFTPATHEIKVEHQVYIYQVILTFGLLAAMLRGLELLPVHGALLDNDRETLLLCGESGVGKSTTARRWRQAGGKCYADDLILVDYSDDNIFSQPLPTWSSCKESLQDKDFPVARRKPLKAVLGLSRGKIAEYIAPISGDDFFAQLYRSSFFHVYGVAGCLPQDQQKKLGQAIRRGVEKLVDKFPPFGLFAHLDGDLKQTLKDYL